MAASPPRGDMTAVGSESCRITIRSDQAGNSKNGSRRIYRPSTRDATVRRQHVQPQGIDVRTLSAWREEQPKRAKVADAPALINEMTTKLANIRGRYWQSSENAKGGAP
ncbi:hypothetical protein Pst134EA_006839 [Puccinia striiformis f. sp. tritici]|uniref:hypothetical protein n=1 Tax=Puccinia striiformis f. sp. tritici TaxID=168172 RepID=UPI002007F167|nr:hypothetical protein Pst134EA_006839 [Puccinia striiformis f. sp. tritici]KAH9469545.1 hypothetical protein Pst134EA_006839 [Puccinia striiformis f. sp. tritici]